MYYIEEIQKEIQIMNRCVIIGGAKIKNYPTIRSYLKAEDFNIFCDSGLYHMESLGIKPHLITGDFDSHPEPHLNVETIVLPREKDDTDTVFAAKEALKRGFEEFLLIGAAGERLDHTLGNLSLLQMFHSMGKKAKLLDDYAEMEMVSSNPVYIDDTFAYFSLLNISGTAKGITVEQAKYPLENAQIICEYQYGISNEVLPGRQAKVSVAEGRLLLIKIFSR